MEIFRSIKCRTFRVASVACRASAMPAICVSRMSTGRPFFCRAAAKDAASVAAALSKSNTRFSKSSFRRPTNAASSVCRRRPDGSNAMPKRTSNNVILVIQTDSAGWRSSHATTGASGTVRINAPSTLVSRIIIYQILPTAQSDRAIPAGLWPAPLSQNVPQSVNPVWLHGYSCSFTASRNMCRISSSMLRPLFAARRFKRALTSSSK